MSETQTVPSPSTDRDDVIRTIRADLRRRSGQAWSVTGGRGTAYGWITITAPPARRDGSSMTPADQDALAEVLGLDGVHRQGVNIPAQPDYRREYLDRAAGRTPSVYGVAQWD